MSAPNHTVSLVPLIRRRWLRWHVYSRISHRWAGPGGVERGHVSEGRLGVFWRHRRAIERAQSWRIYAERISSDAGLNVVSGGYLDACADPREEER